MEPDETVVDGGPEVETKLTAKDIELLAQARNTLDNIIDRALYGETCDEFYADPTDIEECLVVERGAYTASELREMADKLDRERIPGTIGSDQPDPEGATP